MPSTHHGARPRGRYAAAGEAQGSRGDGYGYRRSQVDVTESLRSSRRKRNQRRRRRKGVIAVLVIGALLLLGADLIRRGVGVVSAAPAGAVTSATAAVAAAVPTTAAPSAPVTPTSAAPVLALTGAYPTSGPATWQYAAGEGSVLGTAGTLRRFGVAIETGVPEDVNAFAAKVDHTLGDPRSWIAGRSVRLQRVPQNGNAEFTVYLATAETARRMCSGGGVDIRANGIPYTSCRTFGRVIINLSRWRESTPDYVNGKIPLDEYRNYVINHEVGHELGHDHELCTGPGKPAPVMQTQTLGLGGCTANSWPYLNGKRYAGPRA